MSEDQAKSEQTAVEDKSEGSAKQESTEQSGAQGVSDDVEAALSEWDKNVEASSSSEQQGTAESKGRGESSGEIAALMAELKADREERQKEVFQRDLGNVVKEVRGDFADDEVSDKLIRVWLDVEAQDDSRFATAWANRHKEPVKFQRTVKALTKKFATEHARMRKHDADVTADREAVAHAVRGRSGTAPDGKAPDYSKKSNNDFASEVEKEFGFRPPV